MTRSPVYRGRTRAPGKCPTADEVAAALKDEPRLERAQIVTVTASAMVGDRECIAAAGFDGYIQKPINPKTFVSDIARLLPQRLRNSGGGSAER
jgi:CheY-like chemotaxis protein